MQIPVLVKMIPAALLFINLSCSQNTQKETDITFCTHKVILDKKDKLIPWYSPREKAYDHFLRVRWDFIKNHVPESPGNNYPQYYFYCAFKPVNGILEPDTWMNDIGEKIPNWFENARLFYAYSGDSTVMQLMRSFVDYTLLHGTSPSNFDWPSFPYTTTNAGDTLFRGFTNNNKFSKDEIQVDHAGEMGLTYYRMYCYTGDKKYLTAAINVADVLLKKSHQGTAVESVWPYRVIMSDGTITAPYGANWTGCYMLFDNLIKSSLGNVKEYILARGKVKNFLLEYPMKTGYWTDGHTDTNVRSNTYKSNLSASNATLCLFDYPDLDPNWKNDIPKLIKWTEDYFVFRTSKGEPSSMWGANLVGEQDTFNFKMDYQTARYAAECARWFAVSGDESYKEKAYRSLNWVTYCNDSTGMAFESPVSKGILSWWSDCYGECPRMFYQAFAAIPEWAPPHENHILYSEGVLKNVNYEDGKVRYTSTSINGTEFLRLAFNPSKVTVAGKNILPGKSGPDSCTIREIGKGDYAITLKHLNAGKTEIME
jgi:hypothetical protein